MIAVNLKELIGELEVQMDEENKYLNKETGRIVILSHEELSIAEDSEEDEDFSEYHEWQRDTLMEAVDVLENWENYIALPDKFEINEYNIMEDFCGTVDNEKIANELYLAIQGRGAFRRFKDTIHRYNIEEAWYKYHEATLRDIAIEWCDDNEIEYVE